MILKPILAVAPLALLTACCSVCKKPAPKSTPTEPAKSSAAAPAKSFAEFQQAGAKFHNALALPPYETSPDAVRAAVDKAIADANAALDAVGKLAPGQLTFANTIGALDDISYQANLVGNRLSLVKETSTNPAVRDAATDALKKFQEWAVGLDYREDVYRAVKAYADTKPKLEPVEAKLLDETLRDYRRAGLALPKAERDEVELLRKELSNLATDFDSNVTKAQKALKFTRAELEGVPDDFLAQKGIKTGNDEYTVHVNVTWQYQMILENAKREDVRKQCVIAQNNLARQENIPILEKVLVLRDTIAKKLGYRSWADFQLEVKMAKDAKTAIEFEARLKVGLQPKFDAEVTEFRKLKAAETGNPNAQINVWDWRYFANQLRKTKYNIDAEQLRVYFPMQEVLDGMFAIYQKIFGVRFERVTSPYNWVDDLQLWSVTDAATGEPLGCFYLDLFPREGKYNHFAVFPIIEGKRLPDGSYQRPIVALVCNFPPPAPGKPSLLQHSDVETLFHEFGHAMHGLLTRSRFARFSGSNVPRDFVEAPSQMLENWVWDKNVLDSFAADYRDPSKKIPKEILSQLKAAKFATYGCHYRRQLSLGMMDLVLHTQVHAANAADTVAIGNRVLTDVFMPVPEGSAMQAYFGHLMGYDAGYYGYAWADAIAADMATAFEKSSKGYFDAKTGKRLRDEVYSVGDSRDVNVSIEKFLGRPRSIEPFLKKIGVTTSTGQKAGS